jgi:hypothetical protein
MCTSRSLPKKARKKPQGEQNTMLSSKAIKKYEKFFLAFLGRGRDMRNGPQVRRQNLLDQRRAIFFSSLQGCAPATPFPLLQMASIQYHTSSITTSPINCFAPVEYWQTKPILSVVRLSIGIWWS